MMWAWCQTGLFYGNAANSCISILETIPARMVRVMVECLILFATDNSVEDTFQSFFSLFVAASWVSMALPNWGATIFRSRGRPHIDCISGCGRGVRTAGLRPIHKYCVAQDMRFAGRLFVACLSPVFAVLCACRYRPDGLSLRGVNEFVGRWPQWYQFETIKPCLMSKRHRHP